MNFNMSWLTSSAQIVGKACGAPGNSFKVPCLQNWTARRPLVSMGTTWSSVPCKTCVPLCQHTITKILISPYQYRDIRTPQIISSIGLRERLDTIVGGLEVASHTLPPPIPDFALAHSRIWSVEAKERACGHIEEELCSIFNHGLPERVKYFQGHTGGIGFRLDHPRCNSRYQHRS